MPHKPELLNCEHCYSLCGWGVIQHSSIFKILKNAIKRNKSHNFTSHFTSTKMEENTKKDFTHKKDYRPTQILYQINSGLK